MKVSGWGSHPNANRIGKNKMNTVQVSECVYVRVRGEVSEWYVDTLTLTPYCYNYNTHRLVMVRTITGTLHRWKPHSLTPDV